jgi:UDP-glucose 4-epimerase
MGKRVLITGIAGFMGSHLAELACENEHDVSGIDNLSGGFIENVPNNVNFHQIDLRQTQHVDAVFEAIKPQIVFHLAADAREGRSQFTPIACTKDNLLAFMNVVTANIKHKVRKLILTSSMSVYGEQRLPFTEDMPRQPVDIYGINKAAMEHSLEVLASVHNLSYTIIRPHNVFGPYQNIQDPYRNVVGIFMNRIMQDKPPIIYGDGHQTRAFTYIDNVTPYLLQCMNNQDTNKQIINIGPEEAISINQLAELVLEAFDSALEPVHRPPRPLEVRHAHCSVAKAKAMLGYRTTIGISNGIASMTRWVQDRGPQPFKYLDNLEIISPHTPNTWVEKLM